MNELDWQARIVKRLNDQGGYGTKIDTSNLMGRPDLLLATPEARMFMVEVKYEKLWNKNTMRTISITPRQHEEIRLINEGGGTALVLVVVSILEPGERDRNTISRSTRQRRSTGRCIATGCWRGMRYSTTFAPCCGTRSATCAAT